MRWRLCEGLPIFRRSKHVGSVGFSFHILLDSHGEKKYVGVCCKSYPLGLESWVENELIPHEGYFDSPQLTLIPTSTGFPEGSSVLGHFLKAFEHLRVLSDAVCLLFQSQYRIQSLVAT